MDCVCFEIKLKADSVTIFLLRMYLSRQHVSVLLVPSLGLTSIMSRAEVYNYYYASSGINTLCLVI